MNGSDPLLSAEENTADIVGPPTDAEMNSAITSSITHLLTVVCSIRLAFESPQLTS